MKKKTFNVNNKDNNLGEMPNEKLFNKINNENNNNNLNNSSTIEIHPSKLDVNNINKVNNINNNVNNNINNNNISNNMNSTSKFRQKFKLKEIIVNNDVKSLLNYKKQKRDQITIKKCERFCYLSCRCCYINQRKGNKNYNLRYELIDNMEVEVSKKFDIIEVFKSLNQLRLLQKLLLNENQCYLLENRELHTLNNSKTVPRKEIENLSELKEKQRFTKLVDYILIKKQENNLSNIDVLLLKYLNQDLKLQLRKDIDDYDLFE